MADSILRRRQSGSYNRRDPATGKLLPKFEQTQFRQLSVRVPLDTYEKVKRQAEDCLGDWLRAAIQEKLERDA